VPRLLSAVHALDSCKTLVFPYQGFVTLARGAAELGGTNGRRDNGRAAHSSSMSVSVIVTGFGSFHGVPSNPTQRIVGWLQQQYVGDGPVAAAGVSGNGGAGRSHPPAPRALRLAQVHSCTILKVSARAVNTYLTKQLEDLKQRGLVACAEGTGSCHQPTVVLLLHFGVDVHVSVSLAQQR